MGTTRETIAILFSDLKGYSSIEDDHLKVRINQINNEIRSRFLTDDNHIYVNTWGDAFFICSRNQLDLAEIALKIRDYIKTYNWKKNGFSENIAIRIGLHYSSAQIIRNGDEIEDIVGIGIDSTARIEPIVEPNQVYCSKIFHDLLIQENHSNIKGISLGVRKLAKDFGETELFQLDWESNIPQNHSRDHRPIMGFDQPIIPEVNRNLSDLDRRNFIFDAFEKIYKYFENAMNQYKIKDPSIETNLEKEGKKFTARIYRSGKEIAFCVIRSGGNLLGENMIQYSQDRYGDNSMQGYASIEQTNGKLEWKFGFFNSKITSSEELPKYFWEYFLQNYGLIPVTRNF